MKSACCWFLLIGALAVSTSGLRAEPILAVTYPTPPFDAVPRLLRFDSDTPGLIERDVIMSGLELGEIVEAIDFQPSTGSLFALGSTGNLYQVNQSTGASYPRASTIPLAGIDFGMDLSPVRDSSTFPEGSVRIVSTSGQNLRIDPANGAVMTTGAPLVYGSGDPNSAVTPRLTAVAYDNNVDGVTATTLYGIDTAAQVLVRLGALNGSPASGDAGILTTIGSSTIFFPEYVGFDISRRTGIAYASYGAPLRSLFTIDLTTGKATLVGPIGDGTTPIRGLAVLIPIRRPPDVPTLLPGGVLLLSGLLVVAAILRLRRARAARF